MSIGDVIELIFMIGVGLSMGSFSTALIYRLPRHIPYAKGPDGRPVRSMCPPCGRVLTWRELIPVFSWIFQGGQCQCGKTSISPIYPIFELGVMALTLLMWRVQGADLIDTPRYIALPFVVSVLYLAWRGEGWPRHVDAVMMACAVALAVLSFVFERDLAGGGTFLLPILVVLPFLVHGARLPLGTDAQRMIFCGAAGAFLAALCLG